MLRYKYVPKRSNRGDPEDTNIQESQHKQTTLPARPQPAESQGEEVGAPHQDGVEQQTDVVGARDGNKENTRDAMSNPNQPRRRKKRPIHGVKTVSVTRGRSGYGFTISGQHPCVLSVVVPGSQAALAGLKPGDYLVSVNKENVTHYSHDDVVRMVGVSTGTLELQVAENYNSSDSSDDDYTPRTKSRYPNRVRRQGHDKYRYSHADFRGNGQRGVEIRSENARHRHRVLIGGESETSQNSSLTDNTSQERLCSSDNSAFYQYVPGGRNSHKQDSRGSLKHPRDSKSSLHQDSRSSLHNGQSSRPNHKKNKPALPSRNSRPFLDKGQTSKSNSNGMDNATITSTGSVQFQELHSQNISGFQGMFPTSGIGSSNGLSTSGMSDQAHQVEEQAEGMGGAEGGAAAPGYPEDDDSFDMHQPVGNIKAIVGYIGSIEMPSNSSRPHQRIQSLRNAVRRLRIEQKIHTLVLMEVDSDGVKLTNAMGASIAHYPVDRLAFSGVCPDDKRFFGIVTLHCPSDDISEMSQQTDDEPSASSCHIFMVDPELRSHNMHSSKAKAFNIQCTVDPETQRCSEFPRSATPIILCVANLYKDRPLGAYENDIVQSQALANPVQPIERSSSNSSNSDSGLGFGRDERSNDRVNDRVFVVDMPVEAVLHREEPPPPSLPHPRRPSRVLQHLSPDVSTLPRHNFARPRSAMEIRRGLNTSTSSEECWQGSRLNPRAMPDPSLWKTRSSDNLDKQNSAEKLRQSMHRLLQARQRHASETNLSSDTESHDSRDGFLNRSGFSAPRPVSAPFTQLNYIRSEKVEAVDLAMSKLSPRAFHGHKITGRSPSAPPIPYFHGDEDEDVDTDDTDDPFVRSIISRLNRDKALGISNEDPRRYSEGFALAQWREKERTDVAALQKWTKTGSFRRNRGMKITNPLSHSHESLIAGDGDQSLQKLLPANSVNNIVTQVAKKEEQNDIGRVAGWAVNFDKLLADNGGLAVFTEFLKKEFSEENIVFWRACEMYKQLTSDDERKARAKEIFTKHLSTRASDPVNVDSTSRQNAEKHLESPTTSMFDVAQKHIFQLMKQDSYARFLKSEMYKTYLMREMEGKPLDLPCVDSEDAGTGKDKKSGKGKENEKRRRSLLPWRQNKNKNAGVKPHPELELKRSIKVKDKEVNNNMKKCPGPGIDLSTMRKEVFQTKEEMRDPNEGQFKFCRVVLPDGSTTVVCAKPGQSSRSVLGKLCEKRGLSIASVDVFLLGSDKPLDLSEDVSTLGSKEVLIERRVLFRMDFPNKKSIGVKAKPNRTIRDVFKPILNKYGYRIEGILVQLSGHEEYLDTDTQVLELDNQRVLILNKEETLERVSEERPGMSSAPHRPPLPPSTTHPKFGTQGNSKGTLDEITNRIFEDLMKGKSEAAHSFDELGVVELEKTKVHKNPDEHRLSGLFALLRRESLGKAKDSKPPKLVLAKNKVTFAPPKTEGRPKKSDPDGDKLFELLSRAQSQRLEDQRGVRAGGSEIPDFLRAEQPEPTHGPPRGQQMSTGMFDEVQYIHGRPPRTPQGHHTPRSSGKPPALNSFGTPQLMMSSDLSFSVDGHLPSQEAADEYFQMQPVVLDLDDLDLENIENQHMPNAWHDQPRFSPFVPRSQRKSDTHAPIATPEKYSPHKSFHSDIFHEQDACEVIDQSFQDPRDVTLLTKSPFLHHPPRFSHPKHTSRHHPSPPLSQIENRDLNNSNVEQSETSSFQRMMKHSNGVRDLHLWEDGWFHQRDSWENDPLSPPSKGIRNRDHFSPSVKENNGSLTPVPMENGFLSPQIRGKGKLNDRPGHTPKYVSNTAINQTAFNIVDEDETVTFV